MGWNWWVGMDVDVGVEGSGGGVEVRVVIKGLGVKC